MAPLDDPYDWPKGPNFSAHVPRLLTGLTPRQSGTAMNLRNIKAASVQPTLRSTGSVKVAVLDRWTEELEHGQQHKLQVEHPPSHDFTILSEAGKSIVNNAWKSSPINGSSFRS